MKFLVYLNANLNIMFSKIKFPFFSLGSSVFSLFLQDMYKIIMVLKNGNKN